MKIALICDKHFGIRNDSDVVQHHQEKFFKQVFFPYIDQHNIKTVIDLGDTFDRRKYINFKTLEFSKKVFFDELKSRGIDTHIILGNHSVFYRNTNRLNSPDLLLGEYDYKIYGSPQTVVFDGLAVDIIPWICSENEQQIVDYINKSNSTICMGHFELAGFQVIKGTVTETGLDCSLLKGYDSVFSGHFHIKQDNGHVFYLGTPYQMSWSDYAEIKGFHIFDTETRTIEFVPNSEQYFHKIVYDDSGNSGEVIVDYTRINNSYIKLIVLSRRNPHQFDKFMEELYKHNPAQITIVEESHNVIKLTDQEIKESNDTMTLINRYLDSVELVENKDKIKKIMHELYVESNAMDSGIGVVE